MQYRAVLDREWANYNYPWPHIANTQNEADAMCAYFFAKRWQGRDIDIRKLQRIVIHCGCAKAAFLFARDIDGASVRRLQEIVLRNGSPQEKRQFAREIPGAAAQWLEAMAIVQEVMEL